MSRSEENIERDPYTSYRINFLNLKLFKKHTPLIVFKKPLEEYLNDLISKEEKIDSAELKQNSETIDPKNLIKSPSHIILIELINHLLKIEDNIENDSEFIRRIRLLLPAIENYFRFRSKKITDFRIGDDYDEYRTPIASLYIDLIHGILDSRSLDNSEKKEQLKELLKTGNLTREFLCEAKKLEKQNIENKIDTEKKGKQDIIQLHTEITEYYQDSWQALSSVVKFYHKGIGDGISRAKLSIIISGHFFEEDAKNPFSDKLPRKIIQDYIKLVQALDEIDPNAVELLNEHIRLLNQSTTQSTQNEKSAQIKLESIFQTFQCLFVGGKLGEEKLASRYEIYSLQEQEFKKIQEIEKRHIRYLYNFYVKNKTKSQLLYDEENLDKPSSEFEKFCQNVIYNDNFPEPDYKNSQNDLGLTSHKLHQLYYDLKFAFVKDDITAERNAALTRLNRVRLLINELAAYSGCPQQIDEAPNEDSRNECDDKCRERFFNKPYSAYQAKSSHGPVFFERLVTSTALQKKRYQDEFNQTWGSFLSAGLATGEGAVAGTGNYNLLYALNPTLAAASIIPSMVAGAATNYAIVYNDTVETFETLQGGITALHTGKDKKPIGFFRKVLLWTLSIGPSLVSSSGYGVLGGLSAWQATAIILGFFGINLIPVVGWIIFAAIASYTLITVFGLLFANTEGTIRLVEWKDVVHYFRKRFYWPSYGTKIDKVLGAIKCFVSTGRFVLSLVTVALLYITSIKLFSVSFYAVFAKFNWVNRAAKRAAAAFSYINSSIWLYFNFRKGSTVFDLFTPRGMVKLALYPLEIGVRTLFLIPASFCLAFQVLIYPFSYEYSQKLSGLFEWCLEQTAPIFLSAFLNKNMLGRTCSGVDETPENVRPVQIVGGIVRSLIAVIKIVPYVPEVAARFAAGFIYKVFYPIRAPLRILSNWIAKKCGKKWRFHETPFSEILKPRATCTVVEFIASKFTPEKIAARNAWLRNKFASLCSWRRKAEHQNNETSSSILESQSICEKSASIARQQAQDNIDIGAKGLIVPNALGQGATFGMPIINELPLNMDSLGPIGIYTTSMAPQGVCSYAINKVSVDRMINAEQYQPRTLVKKIDSQNDEEENKLQDRDESKSSSLEKTITPGTPPTPNSSSIDHTSSSVSENNNDFSSQTQSIEQNKLIQSKLAPQVANTQTQYVANLFAQKETLSVNGFISNESNAGDATATIKDTADEVQLLAKEVQPIAKEVQLPVNANPNPNMVNNIDSNGCIFGDGTVALAKVQVIPVLFSEKSSPLIAQAEVFTTTPEANPNPVNKAVKQPVPELNQALQSYCALETFGLHITCQHFVKNNQSKPSQSMDANQLLAKQSLLVQDSMIVERQNRGCANDNLIDLNTNDLGYHVHQPVVVY